MGLIPFGVLLVVVGVLILVFGRRNEGTSVVGPSGRGFRFTHTVVGGVIVILLGVGLLVGGIVVAVTSS